MVSNAAIWRRHLVAWRDSGLSQAAYCRRHGLSLACFGYWRGKLRSALSPSAPSTQALVPIVVSEVQRSDDRLEVTLPNGLQACLPVGMEAARWMPMIRALMAC
jgi:hypothetical protein